MYGSRKCSSRPPVHGSPDQSDNTRQVKSFLFISGVIQQRPGHLPAVTRGGHFLQRLADPQVSPDDVVSLTAEHHQSLYTANALLRKQRRDDLNTISRAVFHQGQHGFSGGLQVIVHHAPQCGGYTVVPGFAQHPFQPLFGNVKRHKIQGTLPGFPVLRSMLFTNQLIQKMVI